MRLIDIRNVISSQHTIRLILYLIISILIGIFITIIIGNYGNKIIERNAKRETKEQIEKAIKSFKDAADNETPAEVVRYVRQYTNTVINDQVIGIDLAAGDHIPKKEEALHLFTFRENGQNIDIYIKQSYLEKEMFELDLPLLIEGCATTLIVFTILVILLEQRRQAQIKHKLEKAALNSALEEQKALALLGRMTATLAHELKTPVATLSNLVYALPSKISDASFPERFVGLARQELNRTQQLIDNLLSYGKDITLTNQEWFLLSEFVAERLNKTGLLIECQPIEIYGDIFCLGLLFENLFNNSMQAQAKKVKIRAQKRKEKTEIQYADDGVGFPDGIDLEELIKPFVTHRPSGAGLGLYLVHKIITAHEGTLSIQRSGNGAKLVLWLPSERVRIHV